MKFSFCANHSLTPSLTHTHSHTLSLTHTHTHTHTHSLSLFHSLTHAWLAALVLKTQSFLFGDARTVYDVTLFSFLFMVIESDIELDGLRTYTQSKSRIVNYVNRVLALLPNEQ